MRSVLLRCYLNEETRMSAVIWAWVALIMFATCEARAQSLPTGSAYIASTGGTCAGTLTTSSCRLATVTCKGLWDPVARRVFSVDDLSATLKVTEPSGAVTGVLVAFLGGGSTGLYESAGASAVTDLLTPALNAGLRVVQVAWASNAGLGAWGGSPSSSNYGGDGFPDGPLYLACRPATLLREIAEDTTLTPASGVMLVTGQSGGSSQVLYSLTRYELGEQVDGAVLSGGPPIGELERGCHGLTISSWPAECATLATTGGTPCVFFDTAISGQFVDSAWNDGSNACARQRAPYVEHVSRSLGYQSVFGGYARRRFPHTVIRWVAGDADASEAVPLGRRAVRQLVDATGSTPVQIATTGGVTHTVPASTSGAQALAALLLGGTYNGTTYTAITRTRAAVDTSTWTPLEVRGLELRLTTESTAHLWQEPIGAANGQGLTRADDNGETVGAIDDLSPSGHAIIGTSAGTSPTLASSGISFDGGDVLTVANSGTAFDWVHQTGVVTIRGRLSVAANGTAMQLLENNGSSSANRGFGLFRNSTNTLGFQVTYGSSGNTVFNCTSSFTMTTGDGEQILEVIAGGGGGVTMRWGSSTTTCARLNAPTGTGSANSVLYIGRRASGLNAFSGTIRELSIVRRAINPTEVALWDAYAPTRSSSTLARWVGPAEGYFTGLTHWFDFTDAAALWTDTAGTTNVRAASDTIALARAKHDPTGHLGRDATQSTAAARPTWSGGRAGAAWDGVDDTLSLAAQTQPTGAATWVLLASNRDTTVGSHIVSSSGGRVLLTAPGYDGFAAYTTTHPALGNAGSVTLPNQGTTADALNVIFVVREGSAWTVCAGATCDDNDVNTAPFAISRIGQAQDDVTFAQWWHYGSIVQILRWNWPFTFADRARVRADLCARYSIVGCGS